MPASLELPTGRPAVYLHGGWRCASTYIWSRFRQSTATVCYYEPFHEVLAKCSPRKLRRIGPTTWSSRHPALSLPYRYEYLPLLRLLGRGVAGCREDFAVERFFPADRGIAPELRYLTKLLVHATLAERQAVFGFSRSLARAALIKQALGGFHLVIRRDPIQQWMSCRSYRIAEGSVYFELCHFLMLALAPPHSPAGHFARHLGLPRPPAGSFRKQYDYLHTALGSWSDEFSYRAFLGASLLSYATACPAADLIVDMDRLSAVASYREAVSATLLERTGLEVSFDDCRLGRHEAAETAVDFARVESEVQRVLRWSNSTSISGAQELVDRGLGASLSVDPLYDDGAV